MNKDQVQTYSEFIVGNNLTQLVLENKDITGEEAKEVMNLTIPIIEQAYIEIKDTSTPKQIYEKLTRKAKRTVIIKLREIRSGKETKD